MTDRRTEELLRDALGARADDASWTPTPAASVAHRARGVRRRRRGVAAGAAAAVALTVVVPTTLLGRGDDAAPDPVADSMTVPTIGYAVDGTYHYPDGRTVEVPQETTSVTPTEDGLLVTVQQGADGPARLGLVQQDGSVDDVIDGLDDTSSRPVIGTDGSWAATVIARDGSATLVVEDADGRRATTEGLGASTALLGIDGATGMVTYSAGLGVWQVDGYDRDHPYGFEGTRLPLPRSEGPPFDYTATAGLFVYLEYPAGRAPAVVGLDGQFLWGEETGSPGTFSPDGRLVAASSDEHLLEVRDSGAGDDQRAGSRVAVTIDTPPDEGSVLSDVAWESADTFVATRAVGDARRELVRVGLDGTVAPLRGAEPVPDGAGVIWDSQP